MKTHYITLGLAPALTLALAACGGNNNATTNTATVDNMTGMDMSGDANVADNVTAAAVSPAQKFADDAAASDYYEIEAGKLAQEKGQDQKVKDFGKLMVEHHTASTDKLKAAGAKAEPAITPNPALTVEQEANLEALRHADGAAFDAAYKAQQVAAHEKALAEVGDYAASGDVAALKTFAGDTERVIRIHLTKSREL